MSDPIYFQWQNEYLLNTIYPLRDMKLRDFLIFFYEIDIWQKYKNIQIQSLAADVEAYKNTQRKKLVDAYDLYKNLEAYFLTPDVTAGFQKSFPNMDTTIMAQVNSIHQAFARYFPAYKTPVKEKYFASDRLRQMEDLRKKVNWQISEKQRIVRNNGPLWPSKPKYEADTVVLQKVSLPMVDQEFEKILAFVAAYEKLGKYRAEALKKQAEKDMQVLQGNSKMAVMQAEQTSLQARLAVVKTQLLRYRNLPDMNALKTYFLDGDVSDIYRQKLGQPEPIMMQKINELHKTFITFFPTYNNAVKERYFISQRLAEYQTQLSNKQQELATATRNANTPAIAPLQTIVKMLQYEISQLDDFQWAYDNAGKTTISFTAQIAQAEKDQQDLQNKISANQASMAAQQAIINQIQQVAGATEKDLLLATVDARPVTVNDIVRSKVEDFKNDLLQKDTSQLLEDVVHEFMRNPTRYPVWLQYMVIHFSGMRYQSAHGSWADPNEMLLSLRMYQIQKDYKAILQKNGNEIFEGMSEQRFMLYQSALAGTATPAPASGSGEQVALPALALTKDPSWKRRLDMLVKHLDPEHWYPKYRAMLDIEIAEEDYDIHQMGEQDVLDKLEGLKDQGLIPDWMWKEIVRCTQLRLTDVKDKNWEQVTAEEIEDRYERGMAPFREILDNWKRDNLTGWRQEHDQTSELIVTRAVCNEVAEHIQHIRGRTPSGGLTAKPEWYMRNEKDPRLARVPDKPYFKKPYLAGDFRAGASLFWLNWVNKEPNQWQITRPIRMNNGEELIPPNLKDAKNEVVSNGSEFIRKVKWQEKDQNGNMVDRESVQWLRWMHEATVVEVTETADGPTVLTFETALPGEDRRQSTIGVFKRYVPDLRYSVNASVMIGTFVGYIPEGAVPYDDLHDMLNWNHILLREAFTQAEIDAYWQKVTKPIDPAIAFAMEFLPETEVEVMPMLCRQGHKEYIVCYDINRTAHSMDLYTPEVEIRRGARMAITKDRTEQFGGETFYQVMRCDWEPRAEELYIRSSDLLEVPEMDSTETFQVRSRTPVYRLMHGDTKNQPVFETSGKFLPGGREFQVSAIHKVGPADTGDGVIHGQRKIDYRLIVSCDKHPELEGMFVRVKDLVKPQ
jgi:hypothetical protein